MGTVTFKAASGRMVRPAEDGSVLFGAGIGYLSREAAFDAEEFYQAKRDAELDRWRYPLDPSLVVYENVRGTAFVFDEDAGDYQSFTRAEAYAIEGLTYRRAARAYFEAHPERKPWEDANAGEVWVLTVPDEGDVDAEIVTVATTYGTFTAGSTSEWTRNDPTIITARRVPTEVAA